MTNAESWNALVRSLISYEIGHVYDEDDPNEAIRAEARSIRELLREPFRMGERRRALLETELVAYSKTRARRAS